MGDSEARVGLEIPERVMTKIVGVVDARVEKTVLGFLDGGEGMGEAFTFLTEEEGVVRDALMDNLSGLVMRMAYYAEPYRRGSEIRAELDRLIERRLKEGKIDTQVGLGVVWELLNERSRQQTEKWTFKLDEVDNVDKRLEKWRGAVRHVASKMREIKG